MATTATPGFSSPQPTQPIPNEGQQGQAPQGQGVQGQAPPVIQLLGNWHRVSAEVGQHFPNIADKMQKIASATREALTILAREHVGGGIQQGQGQRVPTDQGAQPQF